MDVDYGRQTSGGREVSSMRTKGGEGVKNWQNLADIFYVRTLGVLLVTKILLAVLLAVLLVVGLS